MDNAKMSADEKRWRAESDAETMARYQEILNDKSRMNEAVKVAKTRAAELNKRADAMQRVASTGNSRSSGTSRSKSTKK